MDNQGQQTLAAVVTDQVQAVTAIVNCPTAIWYGTKEAVEVLAPKGVKNRQDLLILIKVGALDGAWTKGPKATSSYSFHMQEAIACMDRWNNLTTEQREQIIQNQLAAIEAEKAA